MRCLLQFFSILFLAALAAAQTSTGPAGVTEITQAQLQVLPSSPKVSYPFEARREEIQGRVVLGITVSAEGKVETVNVLSGPSALADPTVKTVKKWAIQPHLGADGQPERVYSKITFDFFFKDKVTDRTPPPEPTDAAAAPPKEGDSSPPQRVRVSQGVSQGLLLHQVAPVYPPQARQNRVSGSVILRAVIGKDGAIHDLQVISGDHLLAEAAIAAVQQWRYRPYYLLGKPVEVETQITVNFQLR